MGRREEGQGGEMRCMLFCNFDLWECIFADSKICDFFVNSQIFERLGV